MADTSLLDRLKAGLSDLKGQGLYKSERTITSAQASWVTAEGQRVLNLCANNYLGLSNDPRLIAAAKQALDTHGFGMSSVRFICGTQNLHRELEHELSKFLGTEDTILFSSCFDANGGVFEALLTEEDAVISDALNHASIIDGIRLCKAKRYRYANMDLGELETRLKEAQSARTRLIVTDGVFSMDGVIAPLREICDLADRYGALVMVDDSHAVGFVGDNGRGTHELRGVIDRVDLITGTLGKALGGASGGYVSGRRAAIDWLRQKARPYLFSNSLAPMIAAASLEALRIVQSAEGARLRKQLLTNQEYFREAMSREGFRLGGKGHAIIPVMLGDANLAKNIADQMLKRGVYVVGFSFPVVPQGQARIRTQISASHVQADFEVAVRAFRESKSEVESDRHGKESSR